tara:strand:- start:141 stop:626 length:486 start_codon:yes stop_codon:yes gene_type:complete
MRSSLYPAVFGFFLLGLVFINSAWADSKEGAKGAKVEASVQSELTFILAAKAEGSMDKRLIHMEKDLRRAFAGRFRTFRFHKDWKPALKQGEEKAFALPGGGEMKMSFEGREGPYLRLNLNMPDWNGVVRVRDGKRFFHAGRKHGGDTLIVGLKLDSAPKK